MDGTTAHRRVPLTSSSQSSHNFIANPAKSPKLNIGLCSISSLSQRNRAQKKFSIGTGRELHARCSCRSKKLDTPRTSERRTQDRCHPLRPRILQAVEDQLPPLSRNRSAWTRLQIHPQPPLTHTNCLRPRWLALTDTVELRVRTLGTERLLHLLSPSEKESDMRDLAAKEP